MSKHLWPDGSPLLLPHLEDQDGLIPIAPARSQAGQGSSDAGRFLFCAYRGRSMEPTLSHLDLLEVIPYGDGKARQGDVVLCLPPAEGIPVVHRVVQSTAQGIRTSGDNSARDDHWVLQPKDIVGRVVAAWRGQTRRKVPGGRAGWLLRRWGRSWSAINRGVSGLLRPAYRWLAQSGIARRILPRRLACRVVSFGANGNRLLLLMMGRRVVGRYERHKGRWQIRRPFRLFLDPSCLPGDAPLRPAQATPQHSD